MINRTGKSFTLIETIAAVVILSIAVPPLIWSIRDAHAQRADPIMAVKAYWLASAKLEDIIADRHSATLGYDYLISGNYPDEYNITGYPGFSRFTLLSETQADLVSPGTGYMVVTVQVQWQDTNGQSRQLSISTVLTEYTAS